MKNLKKWLALLCAMTLMLAALPVLAAPVTEDLGEVEAVTNAKAKYYALAVGEQRHLGVNSYGEYVIDQCYRNTNDANNLSAMLKKVKGASGNKFTVTTKKDLTYDALKKAIKTAFKKATKNDVCLFFIATHGNSDGDGELVMPFLGTTYGDAYAYLSSSKRLLPFDVLASWLKSSCKGKVVVLIQSCGAGSAIYAYGQENGLTIDSNKTIAEGEALANELKDDGAKSNGTLKMNTLKDNYDSAKFVNQAVSAFEKADEAESFDQELFDNSGVGAMRTSKFYVLAASRHHEESWGYEGRYDHSIGYNLFTQWLIDGVGTKKKSPADVSPKNKKITLKELFNYIHKFDYSHAYEGIVQHVQVYPKNSSFVVFYWK